MGARVFVARGIGAKEAYTARTLSVCSSLRTRFRNKTNPASSREAIVPQIPDECFLQRGVGFSQGAGCGHVGALGFSRIDHAVF